MHNGRSILITFLCFAIFFCTPVMGGTQNLNEPGRLELMAEKPDGSISIDGKLEERAWNQTRNTIELLQQSPQPGKPTPYRTTVKVLVTKDNLYFGFDCEDPDTSRIAIHTMQRDGNLRGDDSVTVVLDPYGDGRTGYYFQINAVGARVDGLISGPESYSSDWNGIWDADTAWTPDRWTAEIVIPARTLSFTRDLNAWGLNFERSIPRDQIRLRWASPTLDSFLYDMSRAGTLSGIGLLEQGWGLEVSPYGIMRMKAFFGEDLDIPKGHRRVWEWDPGLDVTYRITPQLAAVLTANTDFAETEVDSRQLNITRFPLFFPERRSFFLEGSNLFEFGLGLYGNFIPFFSRRVGLFQGQQIPILVGAKLNGRAGRWNMGVLDVQTRDAEQVPATNLFAGRLSYDISQNLRVGTILTNGHPDGIQNNTLAGFDAVWQTSLFRGNKNFLIGVWTAFSRDGDSEGNRSGYGFKVDYPNDLWDCFVSYNDFGEALNPGLGFLPRPGIRRWDFSVSYKPRPSKSGPFRWIRQNYMQHRYYRVTNYRGEVESWQFFWSPINARLESGDKFEFTYAPTYEYLPSGFVISGVTLPAGEYRFERFRLEFQSSSHRALEFGTTTWFGTFYSGRLIQQQNYLRYTAAKGTYQIGIESEQNFGKLAEGDFIQRLWQLNFTYAFSPDFVLTNFLQYDNQSQNISNNMRLRWTIKPGNDLFIVWNRGWRRLIQSPNDLSIVPETEFLAVKLRWTFRR
jgi:hypothetical protein